MVKMEMIYHELKDNDLIGIMTYVKNEEGNILKIFANFDPKDYAKVVSSEIFELPSLETAVSMFQSNESFKEVNESGVDKRYTDLDVVFILPDNQYGYGYIYEGEDEIKNFRSLVYGERLSEDEITKVKLLQMYVEANRTTYIGDHTSSLEAINEVIGYYCGESEFLKELNERNVRSNVTSTKEAVEIAKKEGLEYIIF